MSLPVPKAELIGTCMEMLGYGAYLVIFIECVRVLWTKYANGKGGVYLSAVALAIFILVTSHLIVDLVRIMAAFTGDMETPNAPAAYYAMVSAPLDVTKTAVYCTVTLISDALIVYRLFAVWGYKYYIALVPALAFFADIGTSVWFIWSLRLVTPNDDVLVSNVTVRSKYFYTVTLILNILCTGGISYKIWMIQRSVSGYSTTSASPVRRVMSVIVESAAIYSAWLIALIFTSVAGSSALFILLNSLSPVIGMVFSAVIIRVSNDRSTRTLTTTGFKVSGSHATSRTRQTVASGNGLNVASHMHTDGVQITLDTITHRDKDVSLHDIEIQSTSYGRDKIEDFA